MENNSSKKKGKIPIIPIIIIWVVIIAFFIIFRKPDFSANVEEEITFNNSIIIKGRATGKDAQIYINGNEIKVDKEEYSTLVKLDIGINKIKVEYKNGKSNKIKEFNINRVTKEEYLKDPKRKTAYEEKIKNEEKQKKSIENEKILKQRELKYGKRPYQSVVKTYLQNTAKDPSSLKYYNWSDVYYNDNDGWLIQCKWAGKNSFGAYITSINWFVIRFEKVVEMKSGDAYR